MVNVIQVFKKPCSQKPTGYVSLCSKHFTADSFESDSAIATSLGISKTAVLAQPKLMIFTTSNKLILSLGQFE